VNRPPKTLTKIQYGTLCLFLLLLALSISGCQRQDVVMKKVELETAPQTVRAFISHMEKTNGFYLYDSDSSDPYLFLNSYWVARGESATVFTDVTAEVQDNALIIHVSDRQTRDYTGVSNNKLLYRIKVGKAYDTIRLFRNSEHTAFTTIGS